jgi:hypothetical protein
MTDRPPSIPDESHTMMSISTALVPAVREFVARAQSGGEPRAVLPLAYESEKRRPWTSIPMTISFVFVVATVTFIMLFVVPKFEDIFKDFHAELPGITKILLVITRFGNGLGLVLLWVLAIGVPVLITRLRTWPPAGGRRSLDLVVALTCLLFLICSAILLGIALFAPMITLIDSISGGPPKPPGQ